MSLTLKFKIKFTGSHRIATLSEPRGVFARNKGDALNRKGKHM